MIFILTSQLLLDEIVYLEIFKYTIIIELSSSTWSDIQLFNDTLRDSSSDNNLSSAVNS